MIINLKCLNQLYSYYMEIANAFLSCFFSESSMVIINGDETGNTVERSLVILHVYEIRGNKSIQKKTRLSSVW